jgi:hypothetical protein
MKKQKIIKEINERLKFLNGEGLLPKIADQNILGTHISNNSPNNNLAANHG